MSKNYDKDSIKVGLTDMEKLRKVPQMYGPLGDLGFVHAIKEVVQNSIDEASAVSRMITVDVEFTPSNKLVRVRDNGRGIPPERIVNVLTELHTSGKSSFNEDTTYDDPTSGAHGVGIKFTNGVSKQLNVNVYRDGYIYGMDFKEGEPVGELQKVKDTVAKRGTGTTISFIPDEKLLGQLHQVEDLTVDMVEDLAYISKKNVEVTFSCIHGNITKYKKIFNSKDGLKSLITKYCKIYGAKKVLPFQEFEFDNGEGISFRVIFTYSKDITGTNIMSYCNNCTTTKGGYHVDGFVDTIGLLIRNYVNDNLNEKEKKTLTVTTSDAKEGLIAVIVASHPKPLLNGQIKDQVLQTEFKEIGKKVTEKEFENIVFKDKAFMKQLFEFVKNTVVVKNKTREMKSSYLKEKDDESTFLGTNGKLVSANGDSSIPKELFIVEGDSAMGSAVKYRDTKSQAIFPVRGKIKNTIALSTSQALENEEIKTLVKILGTNIGPKFNLDRLNYEKIIIMTDADVDGMQISSLLCTFFITHLPEIVKAGHLYRAIPPLYSFEKGGKEIYLNTYSDYVDYMENLISKNYKVKVKGKELLPADIKNILTRNKDYKEEINRLSIQLSITPKVVEDAVILDSMNTIKERKEYLKKYHPYMTIGENPDGSYYIDGISGSQHQFVSFGENFNYQFNRVIEMVSKNYYQIEYEVNDEKMSLYEMLSLFEKFKPSNMKRYKGLGEMNPEDLHRTTMNPNNRTLIRLTMNDLDSTIKRFRTLHGKSQADLYERKQLMNEFNISKEDLDN